MTRIRELRVDDRAEWLRMLRGLYPKTAAGDHFHAMEAFLAGGDPGFPIPAAVFVAERAGGGLAGFLELSVREYAEGCTGAVPYVESWYVDDDVRGGGIGRRLVRAAEDWARARGYAELASDAELDNVAGQDAHRAVGFDEVERAVHYRKAIGDDSV